MTKERDLQLESASVLPAKPIDPVAGHESLAQRFRSLWEESESVPDVFSYLGPDKTRSSQEVAQVLLIDQHFRWTRGVSPLAAEIYLAKYPAVAAVERLKLELIVEEFSYRRQLGLDSNASEFVDRFPELDAARLVAELQSIAAIATSTGANDASSMKEGNLAGKASLPSTSTRESQNLAAIDIGPRYEFLSLIDKGGMGVVYLARHKKLDKKVALKIHHDTSSATRFLREARLLAKVRSSHVVNVYDFDILSDGRCMIAMEWVDGENLQQLINEKNGPLSEAQARPWMRDVALGMKALHDEGVTHRDLKPSNILIERDRHARVADLGLARDDEIMLDLTTDGQVMGTPHYMSPEQADDPRLADPRSDIYSFGATFYHALTGCPPFDGKSAFNVLFQHKTEPLTSPRSRNQTLSLRVNDLLERCLAKSPGDRFQSFGDILKQLDSNESAPSPWDMSDDPRLEEFLSQYQRHRDEYLQMSCNEGALGTFQFPGGRQLQIIAGSITDQDVDAIVSSDNCNLTMNHGVSLAIRRAAGPSIFEEASRYGYVRPGRAVVTSAGDLLAKFVIHGVTIGHLNGPSRDLISEIIHSCIFHAETLDLESIAFPLLGTGGAQFDRHVCLDTIFRQLSRKLLQGATSIRDVRIVRVPDLSRKWSSTVRLSK